MAADEPRRDELATVSVEKPYRCCWARYASTVGC